MGNLGGLEVLVIFLVALIVLGPSKLPDAAKQVGKAVNELRRISGGFQREMREALQDPLAEDKGRERGRSITADQRAARASGKIPHTKAAETDPTKPDEVDTNPTKPDEVDTNPTKPDEVDTNPTKPDEVDTNPTKPDEVDTDPTKPADDESA